MERFAVCALLMVLVFCIQGLNQANAEKCQRTNAKPYRYCVDDKCTTDKDCGKNEKCLCDGDCGLSCIKKGLKCDNFRKPRNAILRFTGPTGFQQTVTYSCKDGYTLRGSKKRTCRGIGKWDGKNTRCPKLCKDPGDIQFGNRRSDRGDRKYYKVGSTMNYWCFLHYRQQGSSKITCTKSGSWSASPPKCLLPSCQKPVIPQNARSLRKLKSRYRYNEIVSFVCEHGYFTAGGRIQRCMQEGKWSGGGRIRCIPKSCGGAGTPKNGRRRGYVFTFKKKVYYECDRGYLRIGPAFRQCQSNQKWSGDTPTCEPIDCRSLPTPQHGEKIEETKTTYHGRVTFQCKKKGHELKGSATRVCQEDGNWDGSLTTCEPVQCKDPGKPNNGGRRPDAHKYVYEDKVVFECKTNFTQKGDSFIICQHDKSWTGSGLTCLAPCSDPGIPKGGYRHHHSFLHGNRVRFSCQIGWKMVGEPTIKCTDGKWDYDAPSCLDCGSPLGMQNKRIPNANIRASSYKDWYHRPRYGRLNDPRAWCSGREWKPYLEIDLGKPYRITHLATQGSASDSIWVTQYIVTHTLARTSFITYRENDKEKLFRGNKDATSVVRHKIKKPFIARKIRFRPHHPTGFFITPACMRVEIYGCDIPTDCVMVGSRVLGRWGTSYRGLDYYYKAYVKADNGNYVELDLENGEHNDQVFKFLLKRSIVLDVQPKPEELQIGTRVLALWDDRYYPGKITHNSGKHYYVKIKNDRKWCTIDQLRLLKQERFCE